ncbi:MAG TPA: SPOR domain-containing protein, partial [Solirubrobacteraceae bacterium]|nr:SPOR domain-containing protein [Solirubrobacteraceae bacterium]
QLQTLPVSGTSVSAVESAKSAATAKGAKAVGALKSEEFSSLTTGNYVIYSGDYHKKAEAEKALTALKKSFPTATVVQVSNGGSGSSSEGSSGGVGSSEAHPAPPTVLESLKGTKGKSYEERSKALPNVVSTG